MSILDILGLSNFSKVNSELKKNNLIPQSMLLTQARSAGYPLFKEGRRDLEIKLLVAQKVNFMAAATSLDRFNKARDICFKYGIKDAGNYFQEYVNLYEYYLKNYNKIGGPISW